MKRSLFCLSILSVAIQAQNLINLPDQEMTRVFSNLGPAVEILGQPYTADTIHNRMAVYDVPGLSIALVENNEIRWLRYFGVMDRTYVSSSRVDLTTRFMVKSLSKPVAAFATMRLVEEDVLDLDVPLDTYLKRWNIPVNRFTQERSPTLRLLLAHSAGFTMYGVPSYAEGDQLPTLVQALNGEPPAPNRRVDIDYIPGTDTRYSGGGYTVLQLLLEDVTGQPFAELMQSLVFDSLDMKRTQYATGMPADIQGFAAAGHGTDGNPIPGKWERIVQLAAGGLIATSEDMATFVIEVNKAWAGESALLSDSLARIMLLPNDAGWGLGFEVRDEGRGLWFSHTGSGDGFRAIMVGFPSLRKGAVILSNSDAGSELRYEILRSLSNEYAWPAYRVRQRPALIFDEQTLKVYEGIYEYSDGSVTTVALEDGQLLVHWKDLPPVGLYAAQRSRFFTLTDEEYTFSVDADNHSVSMTWSGSFGAFTAQRRK